MEYEIGEFVVLNEKIEKDYPKHSGDLVQVVRVITSSPNYKYDVSLPNGDYCPVRENEINKLTDKQKQFVQYIQEGMTVRYTPTDEFVIVVKADYLHEQVEIEHDDNSTQVVCFETLTKIDKETDSVADFKFKVGDYIRIVSEDNWNSCEGEIVNAYINGTGGNSYDVSFVDCVCPFDENELELVLPFEEFDGESQLSLHEEMLNTLFGHYKNLDNTYTVPKQLLLNILNKLYEEVR